MSAELLRRASAKLREPADIDAVRASLADLFERQADFTEGTGRTLIDGPHTLMAVARAVLAEQPTRKDGVR